MWFQRSCGENLRKYQFKMATNFVLSSDAGESSCYSSASSSDNEDGPGPEVCCSKMDLTFREMDADSLETELQDYDEGKK